MYNYNGATPIYTIELVSTVVFTGSRFWQINDSMCYGYKSGADYRYIPSKMIKLVGIS